MNKKFTFPFAVTAGLTVLTVAVRTGLLPFVDNMTAQYIISYLCLAVWGVAAWLVMRTDRTLPAREVKEYPARFVGVAALVAGALIALNGLYEGGAYLLKGTLPPPSLYATGALDHWLALGGIALGMASGGVLIWFGICWVRGTAEEPGKNSILSLVPMGWFWLRLSRYVLSYAMGVYFSQSVFEFVMLSASLLFTYMYARRSFDSGKHIRGDGLLLTMAAMTVAGALSAPLSVLLQGLFGLETGRVSVAGIADVAFAVFVSALLWYWHVAPTKGTEKERDAAMRQELPTAPALQVSDGEA